MAATCILKENLSIKNVFDAMERLRKKGKAQYDDSMNDMCGKSFHMGKGIVTDNLELAEQRNVMQRVVANCSFISLRLRARMPNLPLRKNRRLKVFFIKMILSNWINSIKKRSWKNWPISHQHYRQHVYLARRNRSPSTIWKSI